MRKLRMVISLSPRSKISDILKHSLNQSDSLLMEDILQSVVTAILLCINTPNSRMQDSDREMSLYGRQLAHHRLHKMLMLLKVTTER